jgi:molybdopterin converting factor subunit 1
MGTVSVRLFARVAETAGVRETTVDVGEGIRAGDVVTILDRSYPGVGAMQPVLRYAVNREFVPADHPLQDGDELALIPPVSGGARVL